MSPTDAPAPRLQANASVREPHVGARTVGHHGRRVVVGQRLMQARSHTRAGGATQITGYLGDTDAFDSAVAHFAESYADQTERDHAALVAEIGASQGPRSLSAGQPESPHRVQTPRGRGDHRG